ncbi:ribosomal protein S6 kinase-like 1 isoform X2 [Alligator mississippiensis]|uniref:ribosomal protein S6 kinase-like 1 isoform X2 n=1 Tax=Alligator mississippiensis TaxID=8496 RepID=UPI00287735D8|nr:ribosomal protein S6 kinase-like 1 isoform X2 [Alligator mississippiensis]
MSRVIRERPLGLDSEPCSRAFSQARVYLEQFRSRVSPGGLDGHGAGKRDYLVDAAKQIHLALERDVSEDYEEAFNHYKNGVDVLLSGVQVDPNKERREAVKRKITQYLKRAEEIFNCHLQRTLGNGSPNATGYSSLRFRPIRTLSSPVENLRRCKVLGVIEKVQLVQDPATGGTFILKSLPKSHVETRERQTIIPHGVPFMVKLLRYYMSEDSIFLHLEHVQGGTLWSHLRSRSHLRRSLSYGSGPLHPKPSSALGSYSGEGVVGNIWGPGSGSSQSSNLGLGNGTDLLKSVTQVPLENSDQAPAQEQSPDPSDARAGTRHMFHMGPASGPRVVMAGKDLSASCTLHSDPNPVVMVMAKGHRALNSQELASHPHDLLTSSEGVSSPLEREAPWQDPKLLASGRLPQIPAQNLKAVRNGSLVQKEPLYQQMSNGPQAQPTWSPRAPPGQKQVPGTTWPSFSEPHRPDSGWQEPVGGISGVQDGKGQHREKLASAQQRPAGCWACQGDSQRAWAVNEEQVQLWAAEMLLALEGLHQQGVLCRDLNPRNLLLDAAGHICLTFFGQWTEVEPQCCSQALEELYSAPEVGGISELTEACDWWSFGSLLYELLTGMPLSQCHLSGIHPHTQLHLPEGLSLPAASLLTELLQFDPKRRLGSGGDGVAKLKSHPFFSSLQWSTLVG